MHTRFDDELDELFFGLADMGECTKKSVALVSEALVGKKRNVKEEAEGLAADIKGMYRRLEGICMHLLLRRQPVAGDLRRISSVMKIITDLERIGDNSADVAEVLVYCPQESLSEEVQLGAMCATVGSMLSDAVSAYLTSDSAKALEVVKEDDIVDDYFRTTREKLTEIIRDGRPGSESAPDMMMIAKYLERMGDHAASVATWALAEAMVQH